MLKRNFILIALIVLVGVVSVFFDNETVDEEILPSNQKIDLSNINEVLDTNFQIAEESYVIINLWATWVYSMYRRSRIPPRITRYRELLCHRFVS